MNGSVALGVATTMAACLVSACGDGVAASQLPFSDDVGEIHRQMVLDRELAGLPRTSLPSGVEWMPNLEAAFARATAEDKPVLIATSVPENGDPANDV